MPQRDCLPPQIVAWSNPGDLLSWQVPNLADATVTNRLVRNSRRWFWVVENPVAAHDNYATKREVIRTMFEPVAAPPEAGMLSGSGR